MTMLIRIFDFLQPPKARYAIAVLAGLIGVAVIAATWLAAGFVVGIAMICLVAIGELTLVIALSIRRYLAEFGMSGLGRAEWHDLGRAWDLGGSRTRPSISMRLARKEKDDPLFTDDGAQLHALATEVIALRELIAKMNGAVN